jgi:hypothetical protein
MPALSALQRSTVVESYYTYGFLWHMDTEIEVHERFRRFVRPGDKYVRASYVQ